MEHHADVHIIGGGLGGLVAANVLVRAGRSVVVHDASGKLGGRARTDRQGNFSFNHGPHALYLDGRGVPILQSLGVVPSGRSPVVRGTRMVRGGSSFLGPVGPASLVRTALLGFRAKVDLGRLLAGIGSVDPATLAEVSVDEWISTCTSDAAAVDILRSLVRLTTYVNAPDRLSAEVATEQLQLALGAGVIYLDRGWQSLIDQLIDERIEVRTGRVTELPDAPAVVIATGGPESASALTGHRFTEPIAAEVSVLDLGLSAPPRHPVVLGTDTPIYLSEHGFPAGMTPSGHWSVSLAHYLATGDAPDRSALRRFARFAGVADDQIVEERYLHRMTSVTSIATADRGGLSGRPPVRIPHIPGVVVVGDWVGPRGHLVDAVVCSAHDAAMSTLAHLEGRPVSG